MMTFISIPFIFLLVSSTSFIYNKKCSYPLLLYLKQYLISIPIKLDSKSKFECKDLSKEVRLHFERNSLFRISTTYFTFDSISESTRENKSKYVRSFYESDPRKHEYFDFVRGCSCQISTLVQLTLISIWYLVVQIVVTKCRALYIR